MLNNFAWNRSNVGRARIKPVTLAFGDGSTTIAYSYDGIYWNSCGNNVFYTRANHGCWNGSIWVAVGTGGNWVATSYDGIHWTGQDYSIFTEGYYVAWNGSVFVAAGTGGSAGAIATSADGFTWTAADTSNTGFTSGATYVEWTGNVWIATGSGTCTTATSTTSTGTYWTSTSTSYIVTDVSSIIWDLSGGTTISASSADAKFPETNVIDGISYANVNTNLNTNPIGTTEWRTSTASYNVDGTATTIYSTNVEGTTTYGEYLTFTAASPQTAIYYVLLFGISGNLYEIPKSWYLLGANSASPDSWNIIDSFSFSKSSPPTYSPRGYYGIPIALSNTTAYQYYRILFTSTFASGATENYLRVMEADIFFASATTYTLDKKIRPFITPNGVIYPIRLGKYNYVVYADQANNFIENATFGTNYYNCDISGMDINYYSGLCRGFAYDGQNLLAVGGGGKYGGKMAYSPDFGRTWSDIILPYSNTDLYAVTFNGTYFVMGGNQYINIITNGNAIVYVSPSTISEFTLTAIDISSIQLDWGVNDTSNVQILYNKTGAYSSTADNSLNFFYTVTNTTLTKLWPNTIYYFRITPISYYGEYGTPKDLSMATHAYLPTFNLSFFYDTSAQIAFDGSFTYIDISYGVGSNTVLRYYVNSSNTKRDISNLIPNTNYTISSTFTNAFSVFYTGKSVSFISYPKIAFSTATVDISSIVITTTNSTTHFNNAILSWNTSANFTTVDNSYSYYTSSLYLTGLQSNMMYYFRAIPVGNTGYIGTYMYSNISTAPIQTSYYFTLVSDTSAQIWFDGSLSYIDISYGGARNITLRYYTVGRTTGLDISNLIPDTSYIFQSSIYNKSFVKYAGSASLVTYTLPKVSQIVATSFVESQTTSSIKLEFTGNYTKLNLWWNLSGGVFLSTDISASSIAGNVYTITGLPRDTIFYFRTLPIGKVGAYGYMKDISINATFDISGIVSTIAMYGSRAGTYPMYLTRVVASAYDASSIIVNWGGYYDNIYFEWDSSSAFLNKISYVYYNAVSSFVPNLLYNTIYYFRVTPFGIGNGTIGNSVVISGATNPILTKYNLVIYDTSAQVSFDGSMNSIDIYYTSSTAAAGSAIRYYSFPGTTQNDLQGLVPDTSYTFQSILYGVAGASITGSHIFAYTYPKIYILLGTEITFTSIQLQWFGGKWTAANLFWGKEVLSTDSSASFVRGNTYLVSGLQENTVYYFRAIPVGATGYVGLPIDISVNLYSVWITSNSVSAIDMSAILISWSGSYDVLKTQWDISSGFTNAITNTVYRDTTSAVAGGLEANTIYYFKSTPYTTSGIAGTSFTVTTATNPTLTRFDLYIYDTSAQVLFDGSLSYIDISATNLATGEVAFSTARYFSTPGTTNTDIVGLTPDTSYLFQSVFYNRINQGFDGTNIQSYTLPKISEVFGKEKTFTSVELSWTGGKWTAANIYWSEGTITTDSSSSLVYGNTYIVSGLQENTVYYFRTIPVGITGSLGTARDISVNIYSVWLNSLNATTIDTSAIEVSWSGTYDTAVFVYDISSGFSTIPVEVSYDSATNMAFLSGLDANTIYYFSLTPQTFGDVQGTAFTTNAVTNPTLTQFDVYMYDTSAQVLFDGSFSYIDISAANLATGEVAFSTTRYSSTPGTTNKDIMNLTPDTSYLFQSVFYNRISTPFIGSSVESYTLPQILNFGGTETSFTSIQLVWTGGKWTSTNLYWGAGTLTTDLSAMQISGNSYLLTELQENTVYYFRAIPVGITGLLGTAQDISVNLYSVWLNSLSATAFDASAIELSWTGSYDNVILTYDISSGFDTIPVTVSYTKYTNSAVISGLDTNTFYYFKLTPQTTSGIQGTSFTTNAITNPKITQFDVYIYDTSAQVLFDGSLSYIDISAANLATGEIVFSTTRYSYTPGTTTNTDIVGLTPDTSYLFQSVIYNRANTGFIGTTVETYTLPQILNFSGTETSFTSTALSWSGGKWSYMDLYWGVYNSGVYDLSAIQVMGNTYVVTGLQENTLYNFIAVPVGTTGLLGTSKEIQINMYYARFTSIVYSAVDISTIEISWVGTYDEAFMTYDISSGFTIYPVSYVFTPSTTYIQFTGLDTNTTYYYQMTPETINNVRGITTYFSVTTNPTLTYFSMLIYDTSAQFVVDGSLTRVDISATLLDADINTVYSFAAGVTTCNVEDLIPDSSYIFQCVYYDRVENAFAGSQLYNITLPKITDFYAKETSFSSIQLTWSGGKWTTVDLYWGTDASGVYDSSAIQVSGNTYIITDLQTYTKYNFRAQPVGITGLLGTTLDASHTLYYVWIDTFSAITVDMSAIEVFWSGSFDSVTIIYDISADFSVAPVSTDIDSSITTSTIFTGLAANTFYYFQIIPKTKNGISGTSLYTYTITHPSLTIFSIFAYDTSAQIVFDGSFLYLDISASTAANGDFIFGERYTTASGTIQLQYLNPDTSYIFQNKYYDLIETEFAGQNITVYTLPQITEFYATEVSFTSVQLTWTGGKWTTTDLYWGTDSSAIQVAGNSYLATNLQENTVYSFRAVPVGLTGLLGTARDVSLNLYSVWIDSFVATAVDMSAILVSWTGSYDVAILIYDISADFTAAPVTMEVSMEIDSIVFSGLTQNTVYYFQITPKTTSGIEGTTQTTYESTYATLTNYTVFVYDTSAQVVFDGSFQYIDISAAVGATGEIVYGARFNSGSATEIQELVPDTSYIFQTKYYNALETEFVGENIISYTLPKITELYATETTFTSVQLTWAGIKWSTVDLYWGIDASGVFDSSASQVAGNTYTISGLQENTVYKFSAQSVGVTGLLGTALDISLNVYSVWVDSFTSVAIDMSAIEVSWTGFYDRVTVIYDTSADFTNSPISVQYGSTDTSTIFVGLDANTIYYFQITPETYSGAIGITQITYVNTYPTLTQFSLFVYDTSAQIIFDGSFTYIDISAAAGATGDIVYGKRYQVGTSVEIQDLIPDTSYIFQTTYYDISKTPFVYETINVYTLPKITQIYATEVNFTSVQLIWDGVKWSTTDLYWGIDASGVLDLSSIQVAGNTYTVSGLQENTVYKFRAQPVGATGLLGAALDISFYLYSVWIDNFTAAATDIDSILVSWSGSYDKATIIYDISADFTVAPVSIDISGGTSTVFTGLDANTMYYFQITPKTTYDVEGISKSAQANTYATLTKFSISIYTTYAQVEFDGSYQYIDISASAGATGEIIFGERYFDAPGITQDIVEGFIPDTSYIFQHKYYDNTNVEFSGDNITLYSLPLITQLYATEISFNAVQLVWYGVKWTSVNLFWGTDSTVTEITGNTYLVTDLQENTAYKFRARPIGVTGLYGHVIDVSLNLYSVWIDSFSAAAIDMSAILVSWTGSYDRTIILYDTTTVFIESSTITSTVISGLTQNTIYSFQIIPTTTSGIQGTAQSSYESTNATLIKFSVFAYDTSAQVVFDGSFQYIDISASIGATGDIVYGERYVMAPGTTANAIQGLIPDTSYVFQSRFYNKLDAEFIGDEVTVYTLPQITQFYGTENSFTSVQLMWYGSKWTTADLYWGIDASGVFDASAIQVSGSTYTVTGLQENTVYKFRIQPVGATGLLGATLDASVNLYSVYIDTFSAVEIDMSAIAVSWSGSYNKATIVYDTNSNFTAAPVSTEYMSGVTSAIFADLQANKVYYFQITPKTTSGIEGIAKSAYANTYPMLTKFEVFTYDTSAQIVFDGSFQYIDISATVASTGDIVYGARYTAAPGTTADDIQGLIPDTSYVFQSRYYDNLSAEFIGQNVTAYTLPKITEFYATEIEFNSVQLAWYGVKWTTTNLYWDIDSSGVFDSSAIQVAGNTYLATNLKEDTIYRFLAQPVGATGLLGAALEISFNLYSVYIDSFTAAAIDISAIAVSWTGKYDKATIVYDTSSSFTISPVSTEYMSGVTSAIFEGLKQNTIYYFQITPITKTGIDGTSQTVYESTYPTLTKFDIFIYDISAQIVFDGSFQYIDISSIVASTGDIVYGARYIAVPGSADIQYLTPDTSYIFQTTYYNVTETHFYNQQYVVYTLPKITEFYATEISFNAVQLAWYGVKWTSMNLFWGIDASGVFDISAIQVAGNTYLATNLQENTVYKFRAVPVGTTGLLGTAIDISINVYSVWIDSFAATAIDMSAISVSWIGSYDKATIVYDTDYSFMVEPVSIDYMSGGVTTDIFAGLQANKTYYFQITPKTNSGIQGISKTDYTNTYATLTKFTISTYDVSAQIIFDGSFQYLDISAVNGSTNQLVYTMRYTVPGTTQNDISNLIPDTSYNIQSVYYDNTGKAFAGQYAVVYTLPKMTQLYATEISFNAVQLAWYGVKWTTTNLYWGIDASGVFDTSAIQIAGNTYLATNLQENTVYKFRAQPVGITGLIGTATDVSINVYSVWVNTFSSTAIDVSSITVSWTGSYDRATIVYDTNATFTAAPVALQITSSSINSTTVSGLTQNKIYYFQITPKTTSGIQGTSLMSSENTYPTLTKFVLSTYDVSAQIIFDGSFQYLDISATNGATNQMVYTMRYTVPGTTQSDISNLIPDTSYNIQSIYYDNTGKAFAGQHITTYTLPMLTQLYATEISFNAVQLAWYGVKWTTTNLYWGIDASGVFDSSAIQVTGNTYLATDLQENTIYKFRAQPVGTTGLLGTAIDVSINVYSVWVNTFSATAIDASSITVSWTGSYDRATIVYDTNASFTAAPVTLQITSSTITTTTISGLTQNNIYYFQITPKTTSGIQGTSLTSSANTYPTLTKFILSTYDVSAQIIFDGSFQYLDISAANGATNQLVYTMRYTVPGTTQNDISNLIPDTSYNIQSVYYDNTGKAFDGQRITTYTLPMLTQLYATEISFNAVQLTWYGVKWTTTNLYWGIDASGIFDTSAIQIAGNTYLTTDLQENTVYRFRAQPVGTTGLLGTAIDVSINVYSVWVNTFSATAIDASSITVSWTGSYDKATIVYDTNASFTATPVTLQISSSTITTTTISGLTQNKIYYFQITPKTTSGIQGISLTSSANTYPTLTKFIISTYDVSAQIIFDGSFQYLDISATNGATNQMVYTMRYTVPGTTQSDISNLIPDTSYNIQSVYYDNTGKAFAGQHITTYTLPMLTQLYATEISFNAVQLAWYGVKWTTTNLYWGIDVSGVFDTSVIQIAGNTYLATDLQENTIYKFCAQPVGTTGLLGTAIDVSINVYSVWVNTFSVSAIDASSITVSWTGSYDRATIVYDTNASFTDAPVILQITSSTINSTTVSGLTQNNIYYFQITPKTTSGIQGTTLTSSANTYPTLTKFVLSTYDVSAQIIFDGSFQYLDISATNGATGQIVYVARYITPGTTQNDISNLIPDTSYNIQSIYYDNTGKAFDGQYAVVYTLPKITEFYATEISFNAVQLSWYGVKWTSTNLYWGIDASGIFDVSAIQVAGNTYTATDLQQNTVYKFRAQPVGITGLIGTAIDVSINVYSVWIDSFTATVVDSSSIAVSWTGSYDKTTVVYDTDYSFMVEPVSIDYMSGVTSSIISGLQANKVYYFQITPKTISGIQGSIMTSYAMTYPSLTKFEVLMYDTSAQVIFDGSFQYIDVSAIISYIVNENIVNETVFNVRYTSPGTTQNDISNLIPNMNYLFQSTYYDLCGTMFVGKEINTYTLPKIELVEYTQLTTSVVSLDYNGNYSSYVILYWGTLSNGIYDFSAITSTGYGITNLQTDTVYYARVIPIGTIGYIGTAHDISFYTFNPYIDSYTINTIDSSSINLYISGYYDRVSISYSTDFVYGKNSIVKYLYITTSNIINTTITGLNSNTIYYFRIIPFINNVVGTLINTNACTYANLSNFTISTYDVSAQIVFSGSFQTLDISASNGATGEIVYSSTFTTSGTTDISNLIPDTSYVIQNVYYNKTGNATGKQYVVYTLPKFTELYATEISFNAVQLAWYGVKWTSTNLFWGIDASGVFDISAIQVAGNTYLATDLQQNTVYKFRAQPIGTTGLFGTAIDVSLNVYSVWIDSFAATAIDMSAISVSWTGSYDKATIVYDTNATFTAAPVTTEYMSGVTTDIFAGLQANETYYFQITPKTTSGIQGTSKTSYAITNPTLTKYQLFVYDTSAQVVFDGSFQYVDISAATTAASGNAVYSSRYTAPGTTQTDISNLIPDTSYVFQTMYYGDSGIAMSKNPLVVYTLPKFTFVGVTRMTINSANMYFTGDYWTSNWIYIGLGEGTDFIQNVNFPKKAFAISNNNYYLPLGSIEYNTIYRLRNIPVGVTGLFGTAFDVSFSYYNVWISSMTTTAIDISSIAVSWSGSYDKATLVYDTNSGFTAAPVTIQFATSYISSTTITGLTQNTTYYFKITAKTYEDIQGNTVTSNSTTYATLTKFIISTYDVSAQIVFDGSFQYLDISAANGATGQLAYAVRYRTAPGTTQRDISNLIPDTSYNIQSVYYDNTGKAFAGQRIITYTLPKFTQIYATTNDISSVKLSWYGVKWTTTNLYWGIDASGVFDSSAIQIAGNTYLVNNLSQNTIYRFRAIPVGVTGLIGTSIDVSTNINVTSISINTFTATSLDISSIYLSWSGYYDKATIIYDLSSTLIINPTTIEILSSTITSTTITGLTQNTIYYFQITPKTITDTQGISKTTYTNTYPSLTQFIVITYDTSAQVIFDGSFNYIDISAINGATGNVVYGNRYYVSGNTDNNIVNLIPDTSYIFQGKYYDITEQKYYTQQIIQYTLPSLLQFYATTALSFSTPGIPIINSFYSIPFDISSINLFWSGEFDFVYLIYDSSSSFYNPTYYQFDSYTSSYLLYNLTSNTDYFFKIIPYTYSGIQGNSISIYSSTYPGLSTFYVNVFDTSAQIVFDGSFSFLDISAIQVNTNTVSFYKRYYYPGTSSIFDFSNLSPGTQYLFQATSYNSLGTSYSQSIYIYTISNFYDSFAYSVISYNIPAYAVIYNFNSSTLSSTDISLSWTGVYDYVTITYDTSNTNIYYFTNSTFINGLYGNKLYSFKITPYKNTGIPGNSLFTSSFTNPSLTSFTLNVYDTSAQVIFDGSFQYLDISYSSLGLQNTTLRYYYSFARRTIKDISNLIADTSYNFQVSIYDNYSNKFDVTSILVYTLPNIRNIFITKTDISQNSYSINMNIVGTYTKYNLWWNLSGGTFLDTDLSASNITGNTYTITGIPNKSVYIRALPIGKTGLYGYYDNETTNLSFITPIITVKAASKSVMVDFSNNFTKYSTSYGYNVYWTYKDGSGNSMNNASSSVLITGLSGEISYTFKGTITDTNNGLTSLDSSSIFVTTIKTPSMINVVPFVSPILLTSNTNTITTYTGAEAYRNGTYTLTYSSQYANNYAYNVYNKNTSIWITDLPPDSYDFATYTGSTSTTLIDGSVIKGAYNQIQLPYGIQPTKVSIMQLTGTNFRYGKFVFLGSRTGINDWSQLATGTGSSGNYAIDNFDISSTMIFNYYRIIITTPASSTGRVGFTTLTISGYY